MMGLFTSLNTGLSALNTQMAALQTIGHNVANANTPGYSRQRPDLVTQIPQDLVFAQLGNGVRLAGIQRVVDRSLEERLQNGMAALGNLHVRQDTLQRLEGIFNALSDNDLAGAMDRFFSSVEELTKRPEDPSTRRLVVSEGQTLAQTLSTLTTRVRDARNDLNGEIAPVIDQVNKLAGEIASLNGQILAQENGGVDFGAANDLRDRRGLLLQQLSELVGVKAIETSRGEVNVLAGSEFLVFGKQAFALTSKTTTDRGSVLSTPVFADSGVELPLLGGRLAGIVDSRDHLLTDFYDDLNELGTALISQFNNVHAQGSGLTRLGRITSQNGVSNASLATVPLAIDGKVTGNVSDTGFVDTSLIGFPDLTGQNVVFRNGANRLQVRRITAFSSATGTINIDRAFDTPVRVGDTFQVTSLPFPVVNGGFDVVVRDEVTGAETTTRINVDLDKLLPDTTLEGVRAQIDAIANVNATITNDNKLHIETTSDDLTIRFADDTSGFLAAMGLNGFFTGGDGTTIGVSEDLTRDPSLLAAGRSATPGDNTNALAMSGLRDALVVAEGTMTFEDFYQGVVGALGIDAENANDLLDGQQLQFDQLSNERQRVSGVNIDEEVVHMITFQRAFQASARYIGVIDNLLETLLGV